MCNKERTKTEGGTKIYYYYNIIKKCNECKSPLQLFLRKFFTPLKDTKFLQ